MFAGMLAGAGKGALDAWQEGVEKKRGFENSALMRQFEDENFNPNRALNDAGRRNFRGNLLQNIRQQSSTPEGLAALKAGKGKIYELILQSLAGGMDPNIEKGMKDISNIPGLKAGDIQNDYNMPEFKGAGAGDILRGMGSGALGAFSMGLGG